MDELIQIFISVRERETYVTVMIAIQLIGEVVTTFKLVAPVIQALLRTIAPY